MCVCYVMCHVCMSCLFVHDDYDCITNPTHATHKQKKPVKTTKDRWRPVGGTQEARRRQISQRSAGVRHYGYVHAREDKAMNSPLGGVIKGWAEQEFGESLPFSISSTSVRSAERIEPPRRTWPASQKYWWSEILRPISLVRLSLLRLLDSNIPVNYFMDMRIPHLKTKILLESNPLKSRISVWRLAVAKKLAAGRTMSS